MRLRRGESKNIGDVVARASLVLFSSRILKAIINVVGVAVLARLLTPADFGLAAVAAMILPLSLVITEGLIDVPTIREDELDQIGLANLIWVGVLLMAGLSIVLWLAAPQLATILRSPQLEGVLRVLSFGLLLQPFIVAGHAVLRREHRFGISAMFMPIAGSSFVLAAIGFALLGFGVWSLIFGQIISLTVSATGLAMLSGIPLLPKLPLQLTVAYKLGGMGLATKIPAWFSANIDTLFASAALGPAGAGIYSRAYNITTQLKEPFAVLDQVMRQAFIAQRSLEDAAASRAALDGLRLVVLGTAWLATGIIIMREPVVAVLLGPQWDAVILPLVILAASLPARVARLYLDGFTYARGSVRHMFGRNIAIAGLMVSGLWIWAANGVTAIALVVAAVHLVKLFFLGGAVDIAIAGTLKQRLQAMQPAILLALAAILSSEAASWAISFTSFYLDYALRLSSFFSISILGTLFFLPNWVPKRYQSRLPSAVGFFRSRASKRQDGA